jgi:two-component system sensor histidine kinase VicK
MFSLKVRTKLFGSFLAAILLLTATVLTGIVQNDRQMSQLNFVTQEKEAYLVLNNHYSGIRQYITTIGKVPSAELPSVIVNFYHHTADFENAIPQFGSGDGEAEIILSFQKLNAYILRKVDQIIKQTQTINDQQERLTALLAQLRTKRYALEAELSKDTNALLLFRTLGYEEKEFIFQYKDRSHREEWSSVINNLLRAIEQKNIPLRDVMAEYAAAADETGAIILSVEDGRRNVVYLSAVVDAAGVDYGILMHKLNERIQTEFANTEARTHAQRTGSIVFVGLALIVGLVITMQTTANVNMSLTELSRVAEEVGRGNLKRRAVIRTQDEFEQISESVNKMLSDVDRSQQDLREMTHRSNAIIAAMGEGLLVVDINRTIILMNKKAEDILAMSIAQLIGKSFHDVINFEPEDKRKNEKIDPLDDLFEKHISVYFKMTDSILLKTAKGQAFPVELVMTPLKGEELETIGAIMVFRNVTEQKHLDEAKSNFIAIASHQLRTPLTSIRWYAEMMNSKNFGDLNKEQDEFMAKIYRGSLRLNDIIKVLLSLAQSESRGLGDLDMQLLDFEEVCKESVNMFEELVRRKDLKITIHAAEYSKEIYFDRLLLHQVIDNMVSNAVNYSEKGGQIELSVAYTEKEIVVSVKDDGIGIPKQQQGDIFTRFFRADNARVHVADGSGLGLTFARSLVEGWKGRIWFESPIAWTNEKGETRMAGTAFYFTVPYQCVDEKKCISYFITREKKPLI